MYGDEETPALPHGLDALSSTAACAQPLLVFIQRGVAGGGPMTAYYENSFKLFNSLKNLGEIVGAHEPYFENHRSKIRQVFFFFFHTS